MGQIINLWGNEQGQKRKEGKETRGKVVEK